MGEIADLMISGEICQYCSVELDGEAPGYPRSCEDCGGEDVSDADFWRAFDREKKAQGEANRSKAESEYESARRLALDGGFVLTRKTGQHYQLTPKKAGSWLVNLYPGNQRLYHDTNRPRGPYLKVGKPWTLSEVVEAAIRAQESP